MRISDDLERRERHRRWLRWAEQDQNARPKLRPLPAYKDCGNCEWAEEEDRPCREGPCQLEDAAGEPLPPGPSERYCFMAELAGLPTEAVSELIRRGRLSYADKRDVETLRASRVIF